MSVQPRPIGVFCSSLGGYYMAGMLSGIHQATRRAGVPLIVIQEALGDQRLPPYSSDSVAGWIIIHPSLHDRAHLAELCAGTAPVVIVPVPLEGASCTLIQVDNRGGMRAATLHLLDHGHQRIAYIDHGANTWSQNRYLGYCDALAERGVALDPELVIHMESARSDGADIHQRRGGQAAEYLLERGVPCTALAAPTDTSAIAAMQALQAAGIRVPEQLAVVGFDDIVEAQYASPPLTTVRTQFDALGKAAGEQLLADIREGRSAELRVISVPTTMLHRRSCGCTTLEEIQTGAASQPQDSSWQTALIRRMVQVVRYPLPVDPAAPLDQLWPGAIGLVSAVDAALRGEQPANPSIEAAWRQAIAQTENLELLHMAFTLLEDAAEQRLAASPADRRPAVVALLRRVRLELMRARLTHENASKQQLSEQAQAHDAVGMALLDSNLGQARSLGWLSHTPAIWGCLGLWGSAPADQLTIAGVYQRGAAPAGLVGQAVPVVAFPLIDRLPPSAQRGQDLTILCPVRSQTREWGVLALCGWADAPLSTSTGSLAMLAVQLGVALERNTALTALTEQQEILQASYERERMLAQTIRELGCPIIPLLKGVLLVPLIGVIDSQRAQQIISTVLTGIGEYQAQTILLDITGVPVVDTQVASSLMRTAQAASLLGASVVMVGIRPEIAQSIVGLGVSLQHLEIYSTLASALSKLRG